MPNKLRRNIALFILEGIIIFTAIPLLSYVYHLIKDYL